MAQRYKASVDTIVVRRCGPAVRRYVDTISCEPVWPGGKAFLSVGLVSGRTACGSDPSLLYPLRLFVFFALFSGLWFVHGPLTVS